MNICPYCNNNLKSSSKYCPYCNKSLISYKLCKIFFFIIINAPLYLNLIYYEKLNKFLIQNFYIKNTILIFICLYVIWALLFNFLEKVIMKKFYINKDNQ